MRAPLLIFALCLLLPVASARGDEEPSAADASAPFDAVAAVGLDVEDGPDAWTVVAVLPESPAGRAGFGAGDRILKIGSEAPGSPYVDVVAALIDAARVEPAAEVTLTFDIQKGKTDVTIALSVVLRELDVSVAVIRALDYLAAELKADPTYEKTRPRAYYAPIIYAPLAGLAFVSNGSTRTVGRHAEALRTVLAYVMEHGGRRKPNQDEINKAVRGNICSLTHNAGYSAMFLAQLIDREFPKGGRKAAGRTKTSRSKAKRVKLHFSKQKLQKKLLECCRTLEELQLGNGGWQHGSGGKNPLGYTHLMAATVTAMNGLAMAKQIGVKVKPAVIERGLNYIRTATSDGQVGYAVGNRGSFSAGRNAGALQVFYRLGLSDDDLVAPVQAALASQIGKAGTGHGSPIWHLFNVGIAAAHLTPEMGDAFDGLYRERLIKGQREDGSIHAPDPAGKKPDSGEENRVWGTLYTTPLIAMALQAPFRQRMLLYRLGDAAK